jgi:hypothetical protein
LRGRLRENKEHKEGQAFRKPMKQRKFGTREEKRDKGKVHTITVLLMQM